MTEDKSSIVASGGAEGAAVVVQGVSKSFGSVKALSEVSLTVPAGVTMAVLGPNGAGKTTLVRILTTLLPPDSGKAWVAGYEVVRQSAAVRTLIGLAGQYPAVDENLTGRENLEMVGRLYHLGRSEARRRAAELLERFDLVNAAGRTAKTYSGGMRRRLDLASSLVSRPPVLFLDEPTTGLDPRSRLGLWDTITRLVGEGMTVLLSTQYLEEADRLAKYIVVLDKGRIIAQGTAKELKGCCGGDALVMLQLVDRQQLDQARKVLAPFGDGKIHVDMETGQLTFPVIGGSSVLTNVVRGLDQEGIGIADLGVRQPTLDDVFLTLTGRSVENAVETANITGTGPDQETRS